MNRMTLKAARVNAGLTQAEAAKALDLSTAAVCHYETGKRVPTVKIAQDFCNLYGCTLNDVIFLPSESTKSRLDGDENGNA